MNEKIAKLRDDIADEYIRTEFPNALDITHSETFKAGFESGLKIGKSLGMTQAFDAVLREAEIIYQENMESDPSDYFFTRNAVKNAMEGKILYSTNPGYSATIKMKLDIGDAKE